MKNKLGHDFAFWTGYYGNNCVSWASNKAYLDMNRTMTFQEKIHNGNKERHKQIEQNRKNWRDFGTGIIEANICKGTEDFNQWHHDTCGDLIRYYDADNKLVSRQDGSHASLTYGQAQKWLNMTLKYLWLLYRLELVNDPAIGAFVQKHQKTFHVPLDSYILRYVARQNQSKKKPFSTQDNELTGSFDEFWEIFGSTWSQINDCEKYFAYQKQLAEATREDSPLKWELIHWRKALDYYGKITNE